MIAGYQWFVDDDVVVDIPADVCRGIFDGKEVGTNNKKNILGDRLKFGTRNFSHHTPENKQSISLAVLLAMLGASSL
jgi:hypothetical protein